MVGSLFASKRCSLPRKPPLPILDFAEDGSVKYASEPPLFTGVFTGFNVIVQAQDEMIDLYTKGYFGKGSLSQGYPSYRTRLKKMNKAAEELNPNVNQVPSESGSTIENVTNVNPISSSVMEVNDVPEELNLDVIQIFNESNLAVENVTNLNLPKDDKSSHTSETTEISCQPTLDVSSQNEPMNEELHLTLEEAFFLCYALKCLQIFDGDKLLDTGTAWSIFSEVQTNFIERYVAYHHFRSKGWVVRSGIKYGADYVLYKDGPPFYHATYVVFISNGETDINFYLTCYRAVEVTKKELLVCHVKIPERIDLDNLSECQVSEYTIKRWIPSENRDTLPESDL